MVSEERIRKDELTKDEVLDLEVEEPKDDVEIIPEWEESPEERPGDNLHIDETGDRNELVWERDGFEARLWNHEMTHWKATISIPREYGQHHPRPVDLKCSPIPEYGFVEDVDVEDYAATVATIVIQDNFMPTWEVNKFIDELIESAASADAFQEELTEKLSIASENEE